MENGAPYDDIITELENGRTQLVKNDEVYKQMNGILAVHSHRQDAESEFWRIFASTKERIMQELHSPLPTMHIQASSGLSVR